jgi:hypothetical protein
MSHALEMKQKSSSMGKGDMSISGVALKRMHSMQVLLFSRLISSCIHILRLNVFSSCLCERSCLGILLLSHSIRRGSYSCLCQQNNVTGMVMRALNVLVLASSESLIVLDMFSGLIRGMLTIISAAAARLYIVDEHNHELNM